MALLPFGAPLAEHERAFAKVLHPETVYGELLQRVGASPIDTLPHLHAELASAIRRMGPSGELPWLYALSLRLTRGDVSERIRYVSIYLGAHPFAFRAYGELHELLGQQPELAILVREEVLRRNDLMAGLPGQSPSKDPQPPQTIAALADLWTETVWHMRRGHRPEDFQSLVDALAAAPTSHANVRELLQAAASYRDFAAAVDRGDQRGTQDIADGFRARWPWLLTVPVAVPARPRATPLSR
jgi:hypothetical protein